MTAPTRLAPIRSWLYVPGDRMDRVEKALTLGADAVIVDLEDAVAPERKDLARRNAAAAVAANAGRDGPALFVRLGGVATADSDAEIGMLVRAGLAGLRLPKCEDSAAVARACRLVGEAESAAGLPDGSVAVVCGIESARGLMSAYDIASADPHVLALAFGATDLARDLALEPGPEGVETLYARSSLVVASRAAGIRAPIESVQTDVADLDLLASTTRASRSLGFFGRSVIHPSQIAVVNRVFTPDASEVARAREVLETAERAAGRGYGAALTATGELVDAAVVRRAQDLLRLARDLDGIRS